MTAIDIAKTPFSRYGSYLGLVHEPAKHLLSLRNCRRRFTDDAYELSFQRNNQPVAITVTATPWDVTITGVGGGHARLAMQGDTALLLEAEGLDVYCRMTAPFGYGVAEGGGRFKAISSSSHFTVAFDVLHGQGVLGGPSDVPGFAVGPKPDRCRRCDLTVSGSPVLLRMELNPVEPHPRRHVDSDIEAAAHSARREWEAWLSRLPAVPSARRAQAEVAWFNMWSATVRAEGLYPHDTVLMSKRFMCAVWAWDHAFNAMSLAETCPELAWDQFWAPFALQAPTGVLPDMWNPNDETSYGVTKPPVHGLLLMHLLPHVRLDAGRLLQTYRGLCAWTEWWLQWRDSDGNGIPEYPMGCDSGWDNASIFDGDFFTEGPDLQAFLWLQMDACADLAERIGDHAAAADWRRRGASHWQHYQKTRWNGHDFTIHMANGSRDDEHPTCLLAVMPIVLGTRLDPSIMDMLVARLERDFLTLHGPATEALKSPKYDPNGYWRGPIWAPSTWLIVDGLLHAGRTELALRIARGFCDMCARAGGNYENYDALTGAGLCAPGYTWTAAVHLLFLRLLYQHGEH